MSLNLLPSQAKFQATKIRAIMQGRKVIKIFLSLWIIVALMVFTIYWGERWWSDRLSKKYDVVVSDYLNSSFEIVTNQTIKFRTKLLSKVLADRFEYSNAFGIVGNIFDPVIKIQDFALKEKKYIEMTVVASDNESMKLIESRIGEINLGNEPSISKIVVKDISYTIKTTDWLVSMEVYIK